MLDSNKYYRERGEHTHTRWGQRGRIRTHTHNEEKTFLAAGGKMCNSRYHP